MNAVLQRPIKPRKSTRPKGYADKVPAHQRRVLFAYYLAMGYKPEEAYVQARFTQKTPATEEQIRELKAKARALSNHPRTQMLVEACSKNSLVLLQNALPLVVVSLLQLAFTSKSESIRLRALTEIMDRGGLPATQIALSGKATEYKGMTDEQIEAELLASLGLSKDPTPKELEAVSDEDLKRLLS